MILDLMLDPARFISGILLKHKFLIICIVIIIFFRSEKNYYLFYLYCIELIVFVSVYFVYYQDISLVFY